MQVRILFDTAVLSFVGLAANTLFNSPLVNADDAEGRVIVSVVGTPDSTTVSQLISVDLPLMTSTFQVR